MLIIGGENVFPREIESVLESFDGVLQAAVIGIPNDLRGEAPVAFVIAREGAEVSEQALRTHAKRLLAGFKVPKRIVIRDDRPDGKDPETSSVSVVNRWPIPGGRTASFPLARPWFRLDATSPQRRLGKQR